MPIAWTHILGASGAHLLAIAVAVGEWGSDLVACGCSILIY